MLPPSAATLGSARHTHPCRRCLKKPTIPTVVPACTNQPGRRDGLCGDELPAVGAELVELVVEVVGQTSTRPPLRGHVNDLVLPPVAHNNSCAARPLNLATGV